MTHLPEARIYELTVGDWIRKTWRSPPHFFFNKNSFSQRFAGEIKYAKSRWQKSGKLLRPFALE